MRRDATGATGFKLLRAVLRGVRRDDPRVRRATWRILAVQGGLLGASTALASPLVYVGLWLAPWLTVWQVMNRLRSIAEHGGLRADIDTRTTTHDVRQHVGARLLFVPYRLGWHLAHHADPGIPFRSLPRFHDELRRAGWITDDMTYPSYRSLWRALRAG
jgi:fatty acid desaturase